MAEEGLGLLEFVLELARMHVSVITMMKRNDIILPACCDVGFVIVPRLQPGNRSLENISNLF